jgi:transposase
MTRYLASQRPWLRVERLPAYAPELNPVELLWGNLKVRELANLCPADIAGWSPRAIRLRPHPSGAHAFLRHAGIGFDHACHANYN